MTTPQTHRPVLPCVHCGAVRARYPRGLCRPCFYDKAVRPRYPSKQPRRRDWTAREVEDVRKMVAQKVRGPEVCRRLGRTLAQFYSLLHRENIHYYRKRPSVVRAAVLRLSRPGVADRQVARQIKRSQSTVSKARAALGLPRQVSPAEASRRASRSAYHRHDSAWPMNRRWEDDRRAAAAAGWPPGTSGAEARVLEQLEDGPLPAREIAARLGLKRHSANKQLTALRERGVVAGGGKGTPGVLWEINWEVVAGALLRRGSGAGRPMGVG